MFSDQVALIGKSSLTGMLEEGLDEAKQSAWRGRHARELLVHRAPQRQQQAPLRVVQTPLVWSM